MGLASELSKLKERRESLLSEVAQIDKELEQAAMALGVPPTRSIVNHARIDVVRMRAERGTVWPQIHFWLRSQTTAKTRREIAEGTVLRQAQVDAQLQKHANELIHRGTRFGVSESQFADRSADLEEQRRGTANTQASTSPIAPLPIGATDTLSALTTTANTAPAGIAVATK